MLDIVHTIENRNWEATTLHSIGQVYEQQGQNDQALNAYQDALLIAQMMGDTSLGDDILKNIEGLSEDE